MRISDWSSDVCSSDLDSRFRERATGRQPKCCAAVCEIRIAALWASGWIDILRQRQKVLSPCGGAAARRLARPLPAAAEAQLKRDKADTTKAVLLFTVATPPRQAHTLASIPQAIAPPGHTPAAPYRTHPPP